jgi:hypothetical protein
MGHWERERGPPDRAHHAPAAACTLLTTSDLHVFKEGRPKQGSITTPKHGAGVYRRGERGEGEDNGGVPSVFDYHQVEWGGFNWIIMWRVGQQVGSTCDTTC